MKKNKGISLMVLVITIIIIIILAGSIILSLSSNNPIKQANEAKFKLDIGSFESQLSLYVLSEFAKNPSFLVDDVDATGEGMKAYIPIMTDKYLPILKIVDGKLVFIGTDDDQKDWAGEIIPVVPGSGELPSFMETLNQSVLKSVVKTDDGGYICVGNSTSYSLGFDKIGYQDAIIVKYNNLGIQEWIKNYGETSSNSFNSVIKVNDGFICSGFTSNNTDYSDNAVVAKYDNLGNQVWVKSFTDTTDDSYNSIIKVSDGFICAGKNYDGNSNNALAVKYNDSGDQQWVKNFGGTYDDKYNSIIKVSDGIIFVGDSSSTDAGFISKGYKDAIIVKCNDAGVQQWVKNFGGWSDDIYNSIIEVSDGYICAGTSSSNDAEFVLQGYQDAIIVKYNTAGDKQWIKNLGSYGSGSNFNSLIKVSDGFVCVGNSNSTELGYMNNGNDDAIIVKFNDSGVEQWIKNFGTSEYEGFNSVIEVTNGFVSVGNSDPYFSQNAIIVQTIGNTP